ncbi:MAG: right-handed parallel beta-helix repeat-containing protein [Myxococcota bacterium]
MTGPDSQSDANLLQGVSVTVTPAYPIHGANWNDYLGAPGSDVACDASVDVGCVHGGELRAAVVTGRSSCVGLSMDDALGALRWDRCEDSSGVVTFFSTGLLPQKGLRDLLTGAGWRLNHVTVREGTKSRSSAAAHWWSNPVVPLPENGGDSAAVVVLDSSGYAPGTLFTLAASRVTKGYNLDLERGGIVILNDASSIFRADVNQCDTTNGKSDVGNDSMCHWAAGGRDFLWLEGELQNGLVPYGSALVGVLLHSTRYSVARNLSSHDAQHGVILSQSSRNRLESVAAVHNWNSGLRLDNSSHNYLHDIRTTDNLQNGVFLFDSSFNKIRDLNSANNSDSGVWVHSNVSPADYNSLVNVVCTNNGDDGLLIDWSRGQTLVNVTSANNGGDGVELYALRLSTLHDVVTVNNGGYGLLIDWYSADNTVSHLASSRNGSYGIGIDSVTEPSSRSKFSGTLWIGGNNGGGPQCAVAGGTDPGLVDGTCANQGLSDATLIAGVDLGNSFVGKVSADTQNGSHVNGVATYNTIVDWWRFDNDFRAWGVDGSAFASADNRGACSAASCRIWDWRLAAADPILLFKSGTQDGVAENDPFNFSTVAPCPSQVGGNVVVSDNYDSGSGPSPRTYLVNAFELPRDAMSGAPDSNNGNGLCETNERCLYAPNVGVYQGEVDAGLSTCVFSGGIVSNVTMAGARANGGP